jgi:hypothetical protein
MKNTLFVLLTSLPLSAAIYANEDCPTPPSASEQFHQLDTDGNSLLSKSEFSMFKLVTPCDVKQDHTKSVDTAPASKAPSTDSIFKTLDRDGNGSLDMREFTLIAPN